MASCKKCGRKIYWARRQHRWVPFDDPGFTTSHFSTCGVQLETGTNSASAIPSIPGESEIPTERPTLPDLPGFLPLVKYMRETLELIRTDLTNYLEKGTP